MPRRLSVVVGIFLCLILPASAEVPSSEAMTVARSLVTTMKLGDQYRALLPTILLRIKPVVTQQRAELEKRFDDLISPDIGELYTPYYNEMLEQAATVLAANFTVDEMRQMETFYRQPVGQKLIEKWPSIARQTERIGQDVSLGFSDALRLRLTEALRQKNDKP